MRPSREKLIKRLHADSHPSYKGEIEKEFPKLFKDVLVIGEWYKTDGFLQRFSGKFGNDSTYGFRRDGVYSASMGFHKNYKHVLATREEVKQAIIKEAKERGFKEGVLVRCKGYRDAIFDGEFRFGMWEKEVLDGFDIGDIFKYGIWAEIVGETITKEQAEKELGKIIEG